MVRFLLHHDSELFCSSQNLQLINNHYSLLAEMPLNQSNLFLLCYCLLYYAISCNAEEPRYLKGGSGSSSSSSSGGGRSSGSSSSSSSNRGSSTSTEDEIGCTGGQSCNGTGNPLVGAIVALTAVAILVGGCIFFCCIAKKRIKQAISEAGFFPRLEQTREQIKLAARLTPVLDQNPTSGEYQATYTEGLSTFTSSINLTFKRDYAGWKIEGQGRDNDGTFQVVDGLLSPCGQIYWLEMQGDRQVLNVGQWNFVDGTFKGNWYESNGMEGSFCRFVLLKAIENPTDPNNEIPPIIVQIARKVHAGVNLGIQLQTNSSQQVFLSYLEPGTILGDSKLAAGMPLIGVNHQLIYSAEHAMSILKSAMPLVILTAFRDLKCYDPSLKLRLVSGSIAKDFSNSGGGMSFVKGGNNDLLIADIQPGSPWSHTALRAGMKIWAINDHGPTFRHPEEALAEMQRALEIITIVAEKTGNNHEIAQYVNNSQFVTDAEFVPYSPIIAEAEICIPATRVQKHLNQNMVTHHQQQEQAPFKKKNKEKKRRTSKQ